MEKEYPVVKDDFERAGAASISIKEMLQQLGLSPELVRRVAIGTYEGEINCLIPVSYTHLKRKLPPESRSLL